MRRLRRKALARLDVIEEAFDLLVSFEFCETRVNVFAREFALSFTNRFFALNLVLHAIEGRAFAAISSFQVCLRCSSDGSRTTMLSKQDVALALRFRDLVLQSRERVFEKLDLRFLVSDLLVEIAGHLLE